MKNRLRFLVLAVLTVSVVCALVGCAEKTPEPFQAADEQLTLILVADGQITVATSEEAESIADVLKKAGVTLNDGDILSVKPNQLLSSGMVVELIRYATVSIVLTDGADWSETYEVSLLGATVAEALQEAGVSLAEDDAVSYALSEPLTNGMVIQVTTVKPEVEEEEEYTGGSSGGGSWSGSGGGNSGGGQSTSPERTVVSTERYEDCDGSGHGVMVITYSDGSQEERAY